MICSAATTSRSERDRRAVNDAQHAQLCAVFYAARLRWAVFPLHPLRRDGRCGGCGGEQCAGKHPIPTRWERTIASGQAAETAWRPQLGERGIGLVCGARSGVWVLDIDPDTGGLDTLARLEQAHGPLPATWRSRTGTGGEHVFFAAKDDSVRNSASQVEQGLDVRGAGGYVVLPPTMHRAGRRYEWITPPGRTPPASAPPWLASLAFIRPRKRRDGTRRNGNESLKMIAAGKRHDALIRFCGLLRSCGLGEDAIVECGFALLRHHAVREPPMDLKQAERDMRDVARRYPPTAPVR
jgi:hypothetical protein